MSISNIVVNGVTASYVEVPINTSVAISNDGDGGESSILWTSITGSQPSGTFDAFASPTAFATTITPRKEGNYLIQHTIDGTLTGSVVLAVKFLKSDLASAAAGEKAQFGGETGWARNVQALHTKIDNLVGDGGTVVGYANEVMEKGQVVRVTGSFPAKLGLPGEELTPVFARIASEASSSFQSTVYIVEGPVTGSTGDTAISSGSLLTARLYGLHGPLTGTAVDGDHVWLREDGVISPTLTAVDRKVGTVVGKAGSVYYIHFDGTSDLRPGSGGGGVADLQGAYDGGNSIDVTSGLPVVVSGSDPSLTAMEIFGGRLVIQTGSLSSLGLKFEGATSGLYYNSAGRFHTVIGNATQIEVSTTFAKFSGDVQPNSTNTYDLGGTSNIWNTLYIKNIITSTGSLATPGVQVGNHGIYSTASELNFSVGGAKQMDITTSVTTIRNTLKLQEFSSAPADTAGFGQLWVKSDIPNTLWFTDDTGIDHPVQGSQDIVYPQSVIVSGSAGALMHELTIADSIATDASLSNVFEVSLTGSHTLANPTGLRSGFTYMWIIKQSITTTGSLVYDTAFKFPTFASGTLTPATTDVVDIISGVCSGSTIFVTKQDNFIA